jgi:hypothetical protein
MPHYIIMEMADEYTDEITRMLESGTPVQVFTDKAAAEAERLRLQKEKFKDLEVGQYAYDLDELSNLDYQEIADKLPFLNLEDGDFNEWVIPDNLTDEQYGLVVEAFDLLEFYTVVEVA